LSTLLLKAQQPDTLEAHQLMLEAEKIFDAPNIDFQLGLNKARRAKDLFSSALGKKHRRVADAWYLMGKNANYLPNEHSSDYFYQSYLAYRQTLGQKHGNTIMAQANYAALFGYAGDYEQCIRILKACEQLCENNPLVADNTKRYLYGNLGHFSQEQEQKEYYIKRSIQLYEAENTLPAQRNSARGYETLGNMFFKQGDFEMATQYAEKALSIHYKNQSSSHPNVAGIQTIIADIALKCNQLDLAMSACKQGEAVLIKNFGPLHPVLINFRVIEGNVWALRGESQKALNAWQEASKIARAPGNGNFYEHNNNIYLAYAKYYLQQKQYHAALAWCDSVFVKSGFDSAKLLDRMPDQWGLIKALSLKNQTLAGFYQQQKQAGQLQAFQESLETTLQCVQAMKTPTVGIAFDPVTLNETIMPSIEAALEVEQMAMTNPMERLVRQFPKVQLAKAEALAAGFQANRLTEVAGIPTAQLQQEKQLKKKLADLKSKVAQAEAAKDSSALQKLYAEQLEEKKRFDRLQAQLQKQYPKLAALRGSTPVPNLNDVRQRLLPDDKTALLEYFVGERSIYIFQITRSSAQSWKIDKPADFDDWVRRFHKTASDYVLLQNNPALAKQRYLETANRLSALLLQKPLQQLPTSIQHLIIVPDANLHYVVFDALFTQTAKTQSAWRDFPYLLKKYAVSYGFSTGLLLEQYARAGKRPAQGFLGFAPQYKSSKLKANDTLRLAQLAIRVRNGEYELPGAQKEVAAIAELTGGRQVRAAEASEANFRRYAGDYAVLHLAMHAISDDRYPALSGLLFTPNPADTTYDNHLTLAEIYGLSLPAEMAVLTACNSGAGKLRRGEGILSLGRAFTYAGVRSTVMSQWQAADQQTSRLMLLFYQELEKGLPKDVALQVAKQQYLATAQNPDLGHPFFWAGFVLNGNAEPLSLPNPNGWYWVVLGLVVVIGVGLWRAFGGKKRVSSLVQ